VRLLHDVWGDLCQWQRDETVGSLAEVCEDQRRQTRRGPIASRVTYVAYNMHSRHFHNVAGLHLGMDSRRELVVATGVRGGSQGPGARRHGSWIDGGRGRSFGSGGVLQSTEDAAVLAAAGAHSKAVAGKLKERVDCGCLSTGGRCRKDAVHAPFTGVLYNLSEQSSG
jgi:hypothetical protein